MTELEHYQPAEITQRVADLRNPATDSWTSVLEEVGTLAQRISSTDFVPDGFRNNVAATAAAILYGREVGLGPLQSLSTLHSIKGRVGMSAETMRALVFREGHEIVIVESTAARCTLKGRRRGSQEWTSVTWTIDDARQAKLGGDNWTKYARQMLQARASAELCRLIFPDVVRGLAATEELEQLGGDTVPAISVGQTASTTKVQRARRKPDPAPEAVEPPPPPPPEPPTPEADPTPPAPVEPPEPPLEPTPEPQQLSKKQRDLLLVRFAELDVTERPERLYIASTIVGRPLGSANDLTTAEASRLIDALAPVGDRDGLEDLLRAIAEPELLVE
jgi:hypothetical protein